MGLATGGDVATAMGLVTRGEEIAAVRLATGGNDVTAVRLVTSDPGAICSTTWVAQADPAPDTVDARASHVSGRDNDNGDWATRDMLLC